MSDMVDVAFYVTLEPRWSRYLIKGEKQLESVSATAITKNRPDRMQRGGTVVMKLTVRVPRGAFYPLRPEAVIEIPENLMSVIPIEVMATDPGMDEE